MELTVSSYMSPWTSFDYSLNLKIRVCGKWSESTIRSDKPIDLTQFARDLAELNANSDEVLLDISNVPDGMMVFEVGLIRRLHCQHLPLRLFKRSLEVYIFRLVSRSVSIRNIAC